MFWWDGRVRADSQAMKIARADFIREVRQHISRIEIVTFGIERGSRLFCGQIGVGALRYILTDASAAEVVATVRSVADGEAVCPSRFRLSLFRYRARQRNQPLSGKDRSRSD